MWCDEIAGRAAWLDKDKVRCLIYWKTPAEWASTIAAWARDCALIDSVVTLEELSSGEDVAGTGKQLPCMMLLKACLRSCTRPRVFTASLCKCLVRADKRVRCLCVQTLRVHHVTFFCQLSSC